MLDRRRVLPAYVCYSPDMTNQPETEAFGKFVRLKLTGDIVEVVSFDSTDITIKFKGQNLTMEHYEVSRIAPEEAAAMAKCIPG